MRGVGEGEKLYKNYEIKLPIRSRFSAGYNLIFVRYNPIFDASVLDNAGELPNYVAFEALT
jgi:hypothetical protein